MDESFTVGNLNRTRLILISIVFACASYISAAYTRADASGALDSLAPLTDLPPLVSLPFPRVPAALSGEQLFQQLHQQTEAAYQPSGHDYLEAKKFMFSKADNTGCGGAPGVLEFYSQICVKGSSQHGEDYKEQGDLNHDGTVDVEGMNAEHGWPQGYFNQSYPMRSDLHHIFPSFITPNSARGNLPFAVVSNAVYSTSNGTKMDSQGFEPADSVKGDAARAMLYFVVRYYDRSIREGMNYGNFWTNRVPMFLKWNRQDPPDANERRRNDLISQFQGNRNPFVDDPSLADKIGAQVFASH